MDANKLNKLKEQVRIGGKGTVRRKHKVQHKSAAGNEKAVSATLKKLGLQQIPAIEEVNMFKDDNKVIHFANPKGKYYLLFFFLKQFQKFTVYISFGCHQRQHFRHLRQC